jgi:hypothetical protein
MSRLIMIMMVIKRLKYSMIGVGEDSGGGFEFRIISSVVSGVY